MGANKFVSWMIKIWSGRRMTMLEQHIPQPLGILYLLMMMQLTGIAAIMTCFCELRPEQVF